METFLMIIGFVAFAICNCLMTIATLVTVHKSNIDSATAKGSEVVEVMTLACITVLLWFIFFTKLGESNLC